MCGFIQGEYAVDIQNPEDLQAFELDGLSRRQVLLRVGAGGLAAALGAQKVGVAYAQDATPAADSGLPEGVNMAASFGAFPVRDLPTEPFTI